MKIDAYFMQQGLGRIQPLGGVRDWMDVTWEKHAYRCFPITLANQYGWGISFPEDISFIWDGTVNESSQHVTIIKGQRYASPQRGSATVSFSTGIRLITKEGIDILSMPPANQFIRGVHPFTTVINTSFFQGELPCAIRITEPNLEITIKAGTPVVSIIPVDLNALQDSEIVIKKSAMPEAPYMIEEYTADISAKNQQGIWTNYYRNATDHKGNKTGEHSVKSIKLKVIEEQ